MILYHLFWLYCITVCVGMFTLFVTFIFGWIQITFKTYSVSQITNLIEIYLHANQAQFASGQRKKSGLCMNLFCQLLIMSHGVTFGYFCISVFVLDFLSALKWVGLSWITYFNLNQNLMSVVGLFACVASNVRTVWSNHTHTVMLKDQCVIFSCAPHPPFPSVYEKLQRLRNMRKTWKALSRATVCFFYSGLLLKHGRLCARGHAVSVDIKDTKI